MNINVMVADERHTKYSQQIVDEIYISSQERGTGIAKRTPDYISQKMLSLHDKYCMDIFQPQYEHEVVAILVTLQHMIKDRESSVSVGTSSSSGD